MHVPSDANGLPLRVGRSAATHDSLGLKPMLAHFRVGHESHSGHSKPDRLHNDKAYDLPDLRQWLHSQRIGGDWGSAAARWTPMLNPATYAP